MVGSKGREQANKASEQNKRTVGIKEEKKADNYSLIRDYLLQNGLSKTNDILTSFA